MPRRPRHDPIGGIHHVMNRGVDHADVFPDDESRVDFGRQLAEVHTRFGVEIVAYCLMGNHYHLVVRCPRGRLSEAMQRLSAVFTRHVNDRFDRDGPIFRGRFTSRPITTYEYLVNSVRYVHRNALDLPGVDSVERYRWSSHRAFLGHRRPVDWLRPDLVLDLFDDVDDFHRFVVGDPPVVGSAPLDFEPSVVMESVEFLLRCESPNGGRARAGDVRAAAFALVDQHPGTSSEALIEHLDLPNERALQNAKSRARRRLESSPELCSIAITASELATRRVA